jgi:hypothetical protein
MECDKELLKEMCETGGLVEYSLLVERSLREQWWNGDWPPINLSPQYFGGQFLDLISSLA